MHTSSAMMQVFLLNAKLNFVSPPSRTEVKNAIPPLLYISSWHGA